MGDKLTSKILAERAGVHIIPGYDGPLRDIQHALEVSNDIGYPVLLKAASGGGGKGMRVCRSDADVFEAFPMATAEGLKFFKDPRLLCEKYVSDDWNALSTPLFTKLIRLDHSFNNYRLTILTISSFKSWRE
jgi:propionyl-CoA carboxylase alpha chain